MKVLIYCQFHYGLGHLTRAYGFTKHLREQGIEVDILVGGVTNSIVEEMSSWPGVNCILVDFVRRDPKSFKYIGQNKNDSFEELLESRCLQIEKIFRNRIYDWVFLESFPFSRRRFRPEIETLLRVLKKNCNYRCGVLHRDVGLDGGLTSAVKEQIQADLKLWIDKIFVFGDENFISFSGDLFRESPEKVEYVGYLPRFFDQNVETVKKQVCVSIGGGIVGIDKLYSLIPFIRKYKKYNFVISEPHNIDPDDLFSIKKELSLMENVKFFNFFTEYEYYLLSSEMTIATCGYNTFLDLVMNSKFPFFAPIDTELEQVFRYFQFTSGAPHLYRKIISKGLGPALENLGVDMKKVIEPYFLKANLFSGEKFLEILTD